MNSANINTNNYDKYTKNDLISIINSMKKKEIFTMMNNYNTQNGHIIDKVIEKNNSNIKKEKITIQKKNLNKLYLQQAMDNNKIYNE
jgi:hypothetical protein